MHPVPNSSLQSYQSCSLLLPDTKEMVPHQEFNFRLAIGIRDSGDLHSEALAKEPAYHWSPGWGTLPLTPGLLFVWPTNGKYTFYGLGGGRNISLEWS